ncbi:ABC transporter ATP-binding protein [Leuconostoc carnosum]|uniref:ABC transporter ATP-binding protein n=2 Tax=Leuconostoc carnosum TaxID=1252 RepID=K0DD57_LEUCJ|nr:MULTISPECIES: ABC transporter ATP-binding protein [Leuconostoc]AFT81502.1 ABC transporter ATP-binding protein [Leuconostoc carnosum JB16]KAA8326104.1 ABC transporter ATP-binding protein [Leuconostoc carnosum]KAA8330308.1 ABC transporter ATP-binding protein [Leuconostoc carnosum]KAA8362395.1 ABC transporter ATP-binding protein [Leuconostoc carnosum]KAA8366944.1 ABC transporter ATP-binding protein [Leuconostoc carnosum]
MGEEHKLKVSARYLTKTFDLGKSKSEKVRAILNPLSKGPKKFWALKGISFDVYEGDVVGIVGVNGSGKSTLLNVLSGLLLPASGTMKIDGETSMLTVSAGLRAQLTGRENIRLKSLMMGKTNKEIDNQMQEIIEFSDLGDFIDQPVKDYSSGMKSKLGFSIAVHQDPDILIIDEALSVGDQTFAQKALAKMNEFKAQGKTIFFVSHSLQQVRQFTDKVMWIQYGDLKAIGKTAEIADEYEKWTKWFNGQSKDEKKKYQEEQKAKQIAFSEEKLTRRVQSDEKLAMDEKQHIVSHIAVGDSMRPQTWGLLSLSIIGVLLFIYQYAMWG